MSDKRVVKNNDWVFVNYTGKLEDGTVFDTTTKRGRPLDFIVGESGLIAGFEKAVLGMAVGDKKLIKLSPAESYGEYDDRAIYKIPIENFAKPEDLEKGMQIIVTLENGNDFLATVVGVFKEYIALDTNHPLAGKTLFFEIEVTDIKDACEKPQHSCSGCCGSCGGSCH